MSSLIKTIKGRLCRWAAVPDDEWPAEEAQQATILADFDPATDWGDRRSLHMLLPCMVPIMLVEEKTLSHHSALTDVNRSAGRRSCSLAPAWTRQPSPRSWTLRCFRQRR
jgi:hypothetical protein